MSRGIIGGNERYRKYAQRLKTGGTLDDLDITANDILKEALNFLPDLKPKGRIIVRTHSNEEWEAIFLDIHKRKGRPIPGPRMLAVTLQAFTGETVIAINAERLQTTDEVTLTSLVHYLTQVIIHEAIHNKESPGGPDDRPKLNEERRVIKRGYELTDQFLGTTTDPELVNAIIELAPDKAWHVE